MRRRGGGEETKKGRGDGKGVSSRIGVLPTRKLLDTEPG